MEIPESTTEDGAPAPAAQGGNEDQYGDKLLKYIPAEVLGGYLPIVLAVDAQRRVRHGAKVDDIAIWGVFAVGVIATIGYLAYQAGKQPQDGRPRPYFYVLAAFVAFPAWALVSSAPLREVSGITEGWAQVIVALVIFCIPWVDWSIGLVWEKFAARGAAPAIAH